MGYSEIRQSGLWKDVANTLNYNFNEIFADILGLENKTEKSKGLFESESELKQAYPDPQSGYWALVFNNGDSPTPFKIYVEDNGQWKNSGKTTSPSIPLAEYLRAEPITDLTEILDV